MKTSVDHVHVGRRGESTEIRQPVPGDGLDAWALVKRHGGLDLNSAYAYVLGFDEAAQTCAVARDALGLAGFVLGLRPPRRPETLFVWQIGVDPRRRGDGLAGRMLDALVARCAPDGLRFVEATVTPSNAASHALFRSFARRHGADFTLRPAYPAALFPDGHEAEDRYRIGPLAARGDR